MNRHLRTVLAVSSLVPLALLAACSASSDEHASSGAEAIYGSGFTSLSTRAGAGLITITYDRDPSIAAAVVQVIGADHAVHELPEAPSTPEHLTTHATTFAPVAPCQHYQWKVLQGSALVDSGWINTLTPSGDACPSFESFPATQQVDFRGVHHARFDHSWCTRDSWSTTYAIFPTGTDWVTHVIEGGSSAWQPLAGYDHYYDPGSDPFPCGEQVVDAYRARGIFTVPAPEASRAKHLTRRRSYRRSTSSSPRTTTSASRSSRTSRCAPISRRSRRTIRCARPRSTARRTSRRARLNRARRSRSIA